MALSNADRAADQGSGYAQNAIGVFYDNGSGVPEDDAEAWASAMAKAIEMGPARLAAMGQAAANRARRLYSVDAMCEATLDAYARVLAARNSGFQG